MALAKEHRLRNYRDFKEVYRYGSRHQSKDLTLRVLRERKTNSAAVVPPPTRIGISISQKVSKKAVVRNLIKRRIQAACQQLLKEMSPGWKIVIVVRPGIRECEYDHFLPELRQLLRQTEVINGDSRGNIF